MPVNESEHPTAEPAEESSLGDQRAPQDSLLGPESLSAGEVSVKPEASGAERASAAPRPQLTDLQPTDLQPTDPQPTDLQPTDPQQRLGDPAEPLPVSLSGARLDPAEGVLNGDWLHTPPPPTMTLPLVSTGAPSSAPPDARASQASSAPPSASPPLAPPAPEQSDPPTAPQPAAQRKLTSQRPPLTERQVQRLEAFVATLERARGASVLIVIKGHPDPDSIGSAVAQQHCFKQFDIQSSIVYFDEISHPENRALVKVIEMDLTLYHEDFSFSRYDYLAFVDSQSADIPVPVEGRVPPILTFVDHHKDTGRVESEFIDIREAYGATSSIYAEYLEYIPQLGLQKSSSQHAHIATALMHGIRTDTDNLMLAGPDDFVAAAYLRQFIDRDLLRMVSKQSVSARTMEIIKQGLNNKVIKGTFLLAGVGFVREEDRDGIAQTADFLLRHEGVETTVVFGIVNNNVVDGSLRTSSATVDPDRWLKDLFGQDGSGKPYGGGRRNKGGFRIPLGLLAFSPDRKALWKLGEQTIHDLIFDKIGEKEDLPSGKGEG